MASTSQSSCGESASKQASNFNVSLILKGEIDNEVLKEYAINGQINLPDKDGKTPLMVACLYGLTQTVQSLLANGADPNSRNGKNGNTPMHYACMVEEPQEEFALSGSNYNPSQWMEAKLAIVKLLVTHGGAGTLQFNKEGWSAVCIAALYLLTDVVDFLLSKDDVSLRVKIEATEILGVSQATLAGHQSCQSAFQTFSKAIGFRKELSLPETQRTPSDLMVCFLKISLKECQTQEEIEESTVAMKGHAFLLGERLFSSCLKQKYLYPVLTKFGIELMFDRNMIDEGLDILSCALEFEHRNELKLGSVALQLACESEPLDCADGDPHNPFHQCSLKFLSSYISILNDVPVNSVLDSRECLIKSLGRILFNEAFYCSNIEILKSLLQVVEKSLRVIHYRIQKENPDRYHDMPSVAFKIMELLKEVYVETYSGQMIYDRYDDLERSIRRVKYAIQNILFSDTALYKDSSGQTALHLVVSCITAVDQDILQDLARAFVRHGCPLGAKNLNRKTACCMLTEDVLYHPEGDQTLLILLSPPTAVLRLEELSIRTILRHNISYRFSLPPCFHEMIESDVKDYKSNVYVNRKSAERSEHSSDVSEDLESDSDNLENRSENTSDEWESESDSSCTDYSSNLCDSVTQDFGSNEQEEE